MTCGIPDIANQARNRLTPLFAESHRLGEIEDFGILEIKDVPNMIKAHNSTPGQEYRMGVVQQRKIQALIWWAKYHKQRGVYLIVADFIQETMDDAIQKLDAGTPTGDKLDCPGKVKTGYKWPTWDIKFDNFLGARVGQTGIPLDYVTQRFMSATWAVENAHDLLKYEAVRVSPS